MSPGHLILVNGASSAGKSTLCRALQDALDEPFLHFSPDVFLFGPGVLPRRLGESGPFAWATLRPQVFEGFFRCLPALLSAGNNLLVDYIVESRGQMNRLLELLAPFDVFFVGLHCPLPELERRELARGDRRVGDTRRDYETVHTFGEYDLEIGSTDPPGENVQRVVGAWKERRRPSAFERMARG
ncbi:chloramphenicol phosphotransferase CPT family protein [Deinococcus planocerae]|uniref:chloramphenicol phosphotransferase CPT family protein n=1 Tax=Deinococcus planocerae TaxID=1737569 RepID=UPI000C7EB28D|nr:chloramphenicol phosphotransferase [Deinococcus planocerae]